MNDLELLEVELAEMRSRFQKAIETLEGLSSLQEQFSRLAQTQKALEDILASTTLQHQNQEVLADQISQLRQILDSKYEFLQVCFERLKGEVEIRSSSLELNLQEVHQDLADLADTTSGLDQGTALEKLQWIEGSIHNLDRLVYADHSLMTVLEQRIAQMRHTLNLMWIVGLVVLGGVVILFLSTTQ
ncbi:hypothetical protein GS597_19815 [Synechococcales cyanobacterium C]|uniref:Uncharacterized protein n=1 Tax=Petrachloros mirabilis ULC683 TaxID=2781853 RepID=A0A8K2A2J7_9CYAN|nr:hypothetical protein [Petrachloros mirabilis]NCJ08712.1 hypothetical protein [Petrachloros mirabilis ULC683]